MESQKTIPLRPSQTTTIINGTVHNVLVIGEIERVPMFLGSLLGLSLSSLLKGQSSGKLRKTILISDVTIFVDTFASINVPEDKILNCDAIREMLTRKSKKRAIDIVPDLNQPPLRHRDNLRYFRAVMLRHERANPVFLLVVDDDPVDLDKAIWGSIQSVQAYAQNPKAPVAAPRHQWSDHGESEW